MAITLSNRSYDVSKKRSGGDTFDVTAGERLKIRVTPGEDFLLNEKVPNGKKWSVSIGVQVSESDA